jgi:hypothetical protein
VKFLGFLPYGSQDKKSQIIIIIFSPHARMC